MSNPGERLICDGPAMERHIAAMVRQLADRRRPEAPLCLVGIRSRGVPLAVRLAAELGAILGGSVDVGAVDITLYRDDLGQGRPLARAAWDRDPLQNRRGGSRAG